MGRSINLEGKVALITGASSGLGKRFAQVLSQAGAKVVLASRRTERLKELRAESEASGGAAHVVSLDVTDYQSIKAAVAHADREPGPHLLGGMIAVREIPRLLHRVHVALDVLDVAATLQHEDLEALLGQLLGRPTAADARADDDGVVVIVCHGVPLGGYRIQTSQRRTASRSEATGSAAAGTNSCAT